MPQVREKINEIALLTMMLAEGDSQGLALVINMCKELLVLAEKDPSHAKLASATKYIIEQHERDASGKFFQMFNDYTSAAQAYCEGQTAAFPGSDAAQAQANSKSDNSFLSQVVDEQLVIEYIETHTLLLDEFEANILDFQLDADNKDGEEFTKSLKRYIHNLKGDSGAIGLGDLESVCHQIEDILVERSGKQFIPQLLRFKEWVSGCLNALTTKTAPPSSADQFMAEIKSSLASPTEKSANPYDAQLFREAAPQAKPTPAAGAGTYQLSGEGEIFAEFVAEAEEHLNNVESMMLDADGNFTKEIIDTVFRGVHSLKGGSAYFTLKEMTETSHLLENLLSEVRDGKRTFDEALTALSFTYIDLQKNILNRAKTAIKNSTDMQTAPETEQFLVNLRAYASGKAAAGPAPKADQPKLAEQTSNAAQSGDKNEKLEVKNFVKVDTTRLDHLIDSIGEMVIYSSMLINQCRDLLSGREDVIDTTRRVEKFGRDLQDIGMSMRLVPIRGLFQKMSRLVWDASRKLGKQIDFAMNGEETELDRNLIDKLADPLMHMVRNSIDHGIETPDEREAKGKPRTGKVSLSAFHSAGNIHIRIEDDGRGLNPAKLVAKAVEKGVIQPGTQLSNAEAFQLIFAAGFSTAAVVTDISGRGVGMDVVRRNVESLRGRIQIESEIDKGSIFTIELPLTLAIIDGIQVCVGKDQFILPSLSIVEFIKPNKNELNYTFDRGETFEFRGKCIPVFRLNELYELKAKHTNPEDATLVVVENNHERVALMVDGIVGEYQTVIKSLGPMFKEGKGLSGCAIMPGGDVALILDVRSLVAYARQKVTTTKSTVIEDAMMAIAADKKANGPQLDRVN